MSDLQPITSAEPAPAPIAVPVVPDVTNDTTSSIQTVASDSQASAEPKLGSVVEQSVPADNVPASWLWLTKHDQTFVAVCVVMFLALVTIVCSTMR